MYIVPVPVVCQFHRRQFLRWNFGYLAAQRIAKSGNQPGFEPLAPGRQGCRKVGELQWRDQHISLSNTGNYRLAGKPDSLGASVKGAALPVPRRQQAAFLARQVYPGGLAKTEIRQHRVNAVNAQFHRQHIEKNIAGFGDCSV